MHHIKSPLRCSGARQWAICSPVHSNSLGFSISRRQFASALSRRLQEGTPAEKRRWPLRASRKREPLAILSRGLRVFGAAGPALRGAGPPVPSQLRPCARPGSGGNRPGLLRGSSAPCALGRVLLPRGQDLRDGGLRANRELPRVLGARADRGCAPSGTVMGVGSAAACAEIAFLAYWCGGRRCGKGSLLAQCPFACSCSPVPCTWLV